MYLGTCNRLELIFSLSKPVDGDLLRKVLKSFRPEWKERDFKWAKSHALMLKGEDAVKHLLEVRHRSILW